MCFTPDVQRSRPRRWCPKPPESRLLVGIGLLFAFVILSLCGSQSSVTADAIDDVVHREMVRSSVPGVAVLVIRHGRVIKNKGYGYANLEHRTVVKQNTVFESGSMGKQFTATLVMLLVQDGRLKLGDSIVSIFPEGKGKWEAVSFRHLLNHTSGIGDIPYDTMDMAHHYSEQDLVNLMARQPMSEVPGKTWSYCNGGYVLLGALIRRVTGKFYGDMLQKRIFEPLGMKTARVISEHEIVMNRASGYQMEKGEIKNQDWVSPSLNNTADGSLYLGLDDMLRWDAAMYDYSILKQDTLSQMWEPARLIDGSAAVVNPGDPIPVYYAMGWTICRQPGLTCIAHAGGWQGFSTYYVRIPETKTSVVVLANLDMADAATIGKKILERLEPTLRDGRMEADSRVP